MRGRIACLIAMQTLLHFIGDVSAQKCLPDFSGDTLCPTMANNCYACDPGRYKDHFGDTKCSQCPQRSWTEVSGSTSVTSCVCNAGYVGVNGGQGCTSCAAGTYKSTPGSVGCMSCPANTGAACNACTSRRTAYATLGSTDRQAARAPRARRTRVSRVRGVTAADCSYNADFYGPAGGALTRVRRVHPREQRGFVQHGQAWILCFRQRKYVHRLSGQHRRLVHGVHCRQRMCMQRWILRAEWRLVHRVSSRFNFDCKKHHIDRVQMQRWILRTRRRHVHRMSGWKVQARGRRKTMP
jgi:hypothetical protein